MVARRQAAASAPSATLGDRTGDSRQRLIDAAIDLFLNVGYQAVRISDITDYARLGKGTFYLHFNDKRDLLLACFRSVIETVEAGTAEYEAAHLDYLSKSRPPDQLCDRPRRPLDEHRLLSSGVRLCEGRGDRRRRPRGARHTGAARYRRTHRRHRGRNGARGRPRSRRIDHRRNDGGPCLAPQARSAVRGRHSVRFRRRLPTAGVRAASRRAREVCARRGDSRSGRPAGGFGAIGTPAALASR